MLGTAKSGARFPHGLGRRSEGVLLTLRSELDGGQFGAGQKVPSETELCERFKVSRPTVRRAIARLVGEGKLEVVHGSGMYVPQSVRGPSLPAKVAVMYNFEGEDLTEAQDYALAQGFLFSVFSQRRQNWDVKAERAFLTLVLRERHAALLAFCSPLAPRNDELLHKLAAAGVRVVHVEHYSEFLPAEEYILPDYARAGHMAAVALLLAGYERVLFAGLNLDAPYSKLVKQGVVAALEEHRGGGLRDEDCFRFPIGITSDPHAQQQVRDFLSGLGDSAGIVCDSAGIANYLLEAARALNLRVPEHLGVVGPQLAGPRRGYAVDSLEFDRKRILLRALEVALGKKGPPVRELVAPKLLRQGTIRSSK